MDENKIDELNRYERARKRVNEIKGFYIHLMCYLLVIPFLIYINYATYWDFQWFWFPLLGWGAGLTAHGLTVFGMGKKWEERKIAELMEEDDF